MHKCSRHFIQRLCHNHLSTRSKYGLSIWAYHCHSDSLCTGNEMQLYWNWWEQKREVGRVSSFWKHPFLFSKHWLLERTKIVDYKNRRTIYFQTCRKYILMPVGPFILGHNRWLTKLDFQVLKTARFIRPSLGPQVHHTHTTRGRASLHSYWRCSKYWKSRCFSEAKGRQLHHLVLERPNFEVRRVIFGRVQTNLLFCSIVIPCLR